MCALFPYLSDRKRRFFSNSRRAVVRIALVEKRNLSPREVHTLQQVLGGRVSLKSARDSFCTASHEHRQGHLAKTTHVPSQKSRVGNARYDLSPTL